MCSAAAEAPLGALVGAGIAVGASRLSTDDSSWDQGLQAGRSGVVRWYLELRDGGLGAQRRL